MANGSTYPIAVVINPAGAVAGANAVGASLVNLEARASSLETVLKRVFSAVLIVQSVGKAIGVVSDFGQQMATLKAVLSDTGTLTENTFNRLRETALNMGMTTRFSATQAAEGMTILAKAGYTAGESMEAVTGVLNLAQAGAISMGRSADIVTSILRGFNMTTADTTKMVDLLVRAANASNADVTDFGQAMKFVAPIAQGMKMSIEDVIAVLEVLSNAGLKGSMAGTGLRRVLGALEGPTTTQIKMLHELGLTADDVKVSLHGMENVMKLIGSRTDDVGKFLNMFGQRGGPAAKVIDDYTGKIERYAEQNREAQDAGINMAAIMNDTLAGAIDRVRAAFGVLIIKMSDLGAEKSLRNLLEDLADDFRYLARHAYDFGDALKILAVGFTIAYTASSKFANELNALKLAMASNPATVWIVALTSVVALVTTFRSELTLSSNGIATWSDFASVLADRVTTINNKLYEFIGWLRGSKRETITATDEVTNRYEEAYRKTHTGWRGVWADVSDAFIMLLRIFASGIDVIWAHLTYLTMLLTGTANKLYQDFDAVFVDVANSVYQNIGTALNWLIDKANSVSGVLKFEPIANVDLPMIDYAVPKNARESWADVGKIAQQAYVDALNNGLDSKIVKMVNDAEAKARRKLAEVYDPETYGPQLPPEGYGNPPSGEYEVPDIETRKRNPSFLAWLVDLSAETKILMNSSREYEVQNKLLALRRYLQRDLEPGEKAMADYALRWAQAINDQAQAYRKIKDPMENVVAEQTAINELIRQGKITTLEYTKAMDTLNITMYQLQNTMHSGFRAGLLTIKQEIMNVSEVASNLMVNSFHNAENMLLEFTTTGKLNFSQFIDSVIQDITRLTIRMALLKAFMNSWLAPVGGMGRVGDVPGGTGIPVDTAGVGYAANGLDFMVPGPGGTDSRQFTIRATPGERVRVETPQQQRASASGSSQSIKIVNVMDPSEIPDAMQGSKGEKVILNTITRNRNAVRSVLG